MRGFHNADKGETDDSPVWIRYADNHLQPAR